MRRSRFTVRCGGWIPVVVALVTYTSPASGSGKDAPGIDLVKWVESEPRCDGAGTKVGTAYDTGSVASATFTLRRDGRDEKVSYVSGTHLVFCRTTSATMLWIRLAESTTGDGSDGPHMDIDLCNARDGATFAPMDPRGQPCPGGLTWGIWWHEGPTEAYANRAGASLCELNLNIENGMLEARFTCHGLINEDGTQSLDVLDGVVLCDMSASGGLRNEQF